MTVQNWLELLISPARTCWYRVLWFTIQQEARQDQIEEQWAKMERQLEEQLA